MSADQTGALRLGGIHHVTAVTADSHANYLFYTGVLGLRLVKKTVNQDDVSAYHLFYADGAGSPGTDMTFFVWPAAPERRGTRSIARTGLWVPSGDSLAWWHERFRASNVTNGAISARDGRAGLDFEDPEGQRFCLTAADITDAGHPWERSPVPAAHQIRGLGPVTLSVADLVPTDRVLTDVMNMARVRDYASGENGAGRTHVYQMGGDGPGAELHVVVEPGSPAARPGAGGVHHVAFRTTDGDYAAWADRLQKLGMRSSGPVDRYYFRSLYFREPSGILFEIATDGPGFAVDEPIETLGEGLSLPPFLEPRRREIEAGLKPL